PPAAATRPAAAPRRPPGAPRPPPPGPGPHDRPLGARRLGGAGDLGGAEPVLHPGEIGGDPLGHGGRPPRAVLRLARQAVRRQRDQLGVGGAGAEAGPRRRGLPPPRPSGGPPPRAARESPVPAPGPP